MKKSTKKKVSKKATPKKAVKGGSRKKASKKATKKKVAKKGKSGAKKAVKAAPAPETYEAEVVAEGETNFDPETGEVIP